MASLSSLIATSLPKFGHAGAAIARSRTWNPRIFSAATPRPIQVPVPPSEEGLGSTLSSDSIKGTSDVTPTGTTPVASDQIMQNQDKAYSTSPQNVKERAREMGGHAEKVGEKARQAMQEAWDSTKTTAQRAADAMCGKAHDSVESVKQNAESVKRNVDDVSSVVGDHMSSMKRDVNESMRRRNMDEDDTHSRN